MKTNLFVLCLLLMIGVTTYSQVNYRPVLPEEAIAIANLQLSKCGREMDHRVLTCREITAGENKLAYTIELTPAGYVIVPALKGLPPLIAYSFESGFGEFEPANPLFNLIISDLTKRCEFMARQENTLIKKIGSCWETWLNGNTEDLKDPLFDQWPATGDGWLKTNWTQSPPYNDLCPMDPVTGQRSYAGCPATAMAQVLNFHKTINDTRFDDEDDYYHNYAGRQYWIDNDHDYAGFPSFPELNGCLDTLALHYSQNSILTNRDKAALTFACGVAATQVYTSQGSGTFGVDQAFEAYQRFGFDESELLDANAPDLFDRLSQNIKDTMPAHLAVVDQNWSTGHNVVVDGYNTDDYYHLNFGWGGSYNGWYLIPEELPYNLTVIEGVVLDIKKQTVTGIALNSEKKPEYTVYPNPFSGQLNIDFQSDLEDASIFSLYDGSGRLVYRENLREMNAGRNRCHLETGDLPAGNYLYSITSGKKVLSGKISRKK